MMKLLNLILITFLIGSASIFAQTTTLTYQGRLTDNSSSASGTYQMRFSLFDANSGGTQIGSTIEQTSVSVSNGIFTVALDFGATAFSNGANRFLEIEVRRNSGETYTPLTPRQQVTSTPYSIRSLSTDTATNSTQLGGVNASQYVLTTDSRLSDARTPTAGSNNYVQNTTSSQMGANFNIGGTGTANIFDAATQYNIGGTRVFSAPGTSTFLGRNAGINNVLSGSTGYRNVFVGNNAGFGNTNGYYNTFIGDRAGEANTTAISNTFVGSGVGLANMTGANNSFFGNFTGVKNQTGGSNSFFGTNAGFENVSGGFNTFIGGNSGAANTNGGSNLFLGYSSASGNTTGSRNTFVGTVSGGTNVAGNDNTLLGYNAETGNSSLSFATAIGSGAVAATSNTIQLGRNGSDVVRVGTLGAATPTYLCVNANNILSACSVDSSQYVVTTDPRLSDARTPTAGSNNYIQNRTTTQSGANFDIGGTGEANIFNAKTQFNFNGSRILSSPGTLNTFVGISNGNANTSGERNTFVGRNTGINNTTGSTNTFVGSGAGFENISGNDNSFYGYNSGLRVTTGDNNSIFGVSAGSANLTGDGNSFFGYESGLKTTVGSNTFFGTYSGRENTSGQLNSFFGIRTGRENTTGQHNVFLGSDAGRSNTTGSNNTFVGFVAGIDNVSGGNNSFFGISAGENTTTGSNNVFIGSSAGTTNTTGSNNVLIGSNTNVGSPNVTRAAAIGEGAIALFSNEIVLGTSTEFVIVPGNVFVENKITTETLRSTFLQGGNRGGVPVCQDLGIIHTCLGSSIRFKENVNDFRSGFDLIKKLRPVYYNYKDGGLRDIGLIAEEVNEVDPRLVYRDGNGTIDSVKYDRIGVLLINVVKEQQAQIETQNTQIKQQQQQINELKQIVCSLKSEAEICQEENK